MIVTEVDMRDMCRLVERDGRLVLVLRRGVLAARDVALLRALLARVQGRIIARGPQT